MNDFSITYLNMAVMLFSGDYRYNKSANYSIVIERCTFICFKK